MKHADILPFPSGEIIPMAPPTPINNHIVNRAATYVRDLPVLTGDKTILVREYFLTEVLPLFASLTSGLGDAVDVVKLSLGEEPDINSFESALNSAVVEALAIKLSSFVIDYVGLDEEQALLFLMVYLSKTLKGADNGNVTEALMRKMQSLLDVQRSSKDNAKVQLRKVQEAKGNTRRKRPDGTQPSDTTRRGRGTNSTTKETKVNPARRKTNTNR